MEAYRYVNSLVSYGDEDSGYHARVKVDLIAYPVMKETPKGIWIYVPFNQKKFINLSAKKKFACISKEDALYSFIARKKRQIRILSTQLRDAQDALSLVGYKEEE